MKCVQNNTGTGQSDWMSDTVLASILQPPDVSAVESGEHSGASDSWQGEESSGKKSYLSTALEAFQYLTTNMAVEMCSNG